MSEINTIQAIIDEVKEIIRATSDDTVYPDEFIYALLLEARNLLLYRELNKNKLIDPQLKKTICMPLIKSNQIPCDCIPEGLGCIVLKGKYSLPKPIRTYSYRLMTVTSLDGLTEYTYREIRTGKYNKYRRVNSNKPYYTIINNEIYVIGVPNNDLKAILISAIWEDPSALDDITLCDDDANELTDTCYDPTQDSFQIDAHLRRPMVGMALEVLGISFEMPEDVSNNAESVVDEKSI